MKKYFNPKYLPLLTVAACIPGLLLRFWTRGSGPDVNGLYEPRPLAWVLLLLFTAGLAALIVMAAKKLEHSGTYEENYPKSLAAALCSLPAAVCFMVSGYGQLRRHIALMEPGTTVIDTITGILGIIAGVCLVLAAVSRIRGTKPFFLLHGGVGLYLAIRLFEHCQSWQNQPQMVDAVLPFIASVALMLATWHRCSFDVDLGKRLPSLLWSLMSVYLSVLAIFSFDEPVFYGACALWMIADLCSLEELAPAAETEEPPMEAPEETEQEPDEQ